MGDAIPGSQRSGTIQHGIRGANNDDLALMRRGLLQPDQVRRETLQGLVDSGATKLVLPQAVVKRLGLPLGDKILVRYADGRRFSRGG